MILIHNYMYIQYRIPVKIMICYVIRQQYYTSTLGIMCLLRTPGKDRNLEAAYPSCDSHHTLTSAILPKQMEAKSSQPAIHSQLMQLHSNFYMLNVFSIVFLPHTVLTIPSVSMKSEAYCLPFLTAYLGGTFSVGGCISSFVPCYCVHFWRPGAVAHLSRWPPCQIHLNFRLHPMGKQWMQSPR